VLRIAAHSTILTPVDLCGPAQRNRDVVVLQVRRLLLSP